MKKVKDDGLEKASGGMLNVGDIVIKSLTAYGISPPMNRIAVHNEQLSKAIRASLQENIRDKQIKDENPDKITNNKEGGTSEKDNK